MKKGFILVISWAGTISYPVLILKETKTRYTVKFLAETHLPGNRWKKPGEYALVPKRAVTVTEE